MHAVNAMLDKRPDLRRCFSARFSIRSRPETRNLSPGPDNYAPRPTPHDSRHAARCN